MSSPEKVVFPDCCGLIIVNKFKGGHPSSDPDDCTDEDDLDDYLTDVEQQYYNERSGLLVCLSTQQNERIGHVFLKRKWELLLDGTPNPRTGSKLYLYFRNLNHTKAREKRIFG